MNKFQIVISHSYQRETETKICMHLMQYILNSPSFPETHPPKFAHFSNKCHLTPFQGPSLNGASVASTSQVRPSSILASLTDRRKLKNKRLQME